MKLCLSIEIQEGLSYEETLALARAGEAAGCDAALLADHYDPTNGPPEGPVPVNRPAAEAWVYLGAGWLEAEQAAHGFAFPSGPERIEKARSDDGPAG